MKPINRYEELLANAEWIIHAKRVLCGSLLLVFAMARLSGFLVFPFWLFAIAPLTEMTLNLPHRVFIRHAKSPERIFSINAVLDVVLITVGAYALGDLGKLFALLVYPLIMIFLGVVMHPAVTYLYANLSVVALAGLTFLEHYGALPPAKPLMLSLTGTERAAILLVIFLVYNFTAYFVQYLAGILRKRETQLVESIFRDELTGLASRELFMERLRLALARAKSLAGKGRSDYRFAVLFLDLDRFKIVNDTFGHQVGDQLLAEAARRLEACIKSVDTVAHMGGDEYAILLEELKDESVPARVSERIQEELSLPFNLDGHETFTSASIGIALSADGYESAEEILRDAHTAMYRAKADGKARYEVFDVRMRPGVVARMERETDLRHAVDRGELRLHYQPIFALADARLIGFEALVRWQHPRHGLIPPLDFITLAEEIGLIQPIGRWVIQEACRQMVEWRRAYPERAVSVSVNISGEQLQHDHLADEVARILRETGAAPRDLKFEITESILIEHAKAAHAEIARLRALGVQFDIDDFGMGYSSLSYLRRFHVERLKIDRSFISRLGRRGKDEEITRNIVRLAHGLHMGVVAEGVETTLQLEQLKEMGCDFAQGFYFSKAVPAAEAASAFLATRGKP